MPVPRSFHSLHPDVGVQLRGAWRALVPAGCPPSVHGGAGEGHGTRISHSCFPCGPLNPGMATTEKFTMQNLNGRLASYLERVCSLEEANVKLELQIRQFSEKRAPAGSTDLTAYFHTISDLRKQITKRHSENQCIILQIDNCQMAQEDYKQRCVMELKMCSTVEADVFTLRGLRDSLALSTRDLEVQIEGLQEELECLKSSHEEEMQRLRIKMSGFVDVKVDIAASTDLTKVLEDMREQYEALVLKNRTDMEKWHRSQMEILETEISVCETDVKKFYTQLSELKKSYQTLKISLQSIHTEIMYMQRNKEEVEERRSFGISELQMVISGLEKELHELRTSMEQQQANFKLLLDTKMRLELEISEYRRLLDGQLQEKKAGIVNVAVEEHKPHIERRVKTIVEEIIDGKVVSSTVNIQVEDVE